MTESTNSFVESSQTVLCPLQINLAKQLQDSLDNPHGDRFRYMTHSWLLSLFFDCPPGLGVSCPNASEIEAVKSAIQDGVIHWHAAPFNPQYEVCVPLAGQCCCLWCT